MHVLKFLTQIFYPNLLNTRNHYTPEDRKEVDDLWAQEIKKNWKYSVVLSGLSYIFNLPIMDN